jgi:hypothetical protein
VYNWAEKEVRYMSFKDQRLAKRCATLLETLGENSAASIPEACQSPAATKAAYRFFDNDRVDSAEIGDGFFNATIDRIKQHPIVFGLSDATNIVYTSHKNLKGKGVLRNFKASGFCEHSVFVATPDEQPLGMLYQKIWGRDPKDYGKRNLRAKLPIEQKESYRWIESLAAFSSKIPATTQGVFIGDRGGDICELFSASRGENIALLIRALHDRRLENEQQKLFAKLASLSVLGTMDVEVARGPGRPKRVARCTVRCSSVLFKPSKGKAPMPALNAIYVKEEAAENVDNPIEWRLITTMPIDSLEEVKKYVQWYASRWLIERFHFTLKSGCKIEDLQLEEADRIERAITIYSIIAWRIMFITYAARTDPNALCTKILSTDEWEALYCFTNKCASPPIAPPTTKEAVNLLAKLGGFLGRKSDKDPGMKVLWRGISRLGDITEAYKVFTVRNVGND